MKNYVLILSSMYDFSTDLVVQRLENNGDNFIRINKEQLSDYEIFLDPINTILRVKGEYVDVETSNVKSVWFRQPVFLRNTPGRSIDINEQLSLSQWNAFLRGLMVFDKAYWMNWPQATYAAESKPYQLMIAKKIGFSVPQTIISNSLGFEKLPSTKFIIKSMDTVLLKENDDCYFTYTSKANPADFTLDKTKQAPITFQEYIEDKLDIRVTIVGSKVYAVAIKSNGNAISDDWRTLKKEDLEYVDIELPVRIKKLCIEYVKLLGLNYGAIDFIKTKDEYIFIEINPTGEWGWLSNVKRQIDYDIAKKLSEAN
ncbi:RimK-like protein, partial [Salmonella enterica subsp. enterica serovar Westminster]|nr:RimK-like protein [Salmonella enterica]EBU7939758.1 RimK-like protein [Salmonella enterica subsp. enterica serovar Chittagong]ECI2733062.1 RimK-like protein [Salmonella enterica subsp. enterica]EDH3992614.1 RimK-like protein [Salmonella enterica subsp. enterica serovar Westminster]EDH6305448.1 RimK-like protein [Salmonella enterica subsp. enterica serovar Westminster]